MIQTKMFPETITDLVCECHSTALEKGFWNVPPENLITAGKIALIMSELGEAVEADRLGNNEALGEELADVAIRLFDLAGGLGIDLESIIYKKMQKNACRPPLHGKRY